MEVGDASSCKLGKKERYKKQQNRCSHERERKSAPLLVNHSARGGEEGAPNQSGPGCHRTPREPAERFPSCGQACPHNDECADDK